MIPSIAQIKQAYAETGVEPADSVWLNRAGTMACALGVCLLQKVGLDKARELTNQLRIGPAARALGLSPVEAMGFTFGFDRTYDGLFGVGGVKANINDAAEHLSYELKGKPNDQEIEEFIAAYKLGLDYANAILEGE